MTTSIAYKILVVDDHPETLSIIQSVLQQQGYTVLGARSGFRGLSLAESENPDLILVDGMMPEMDGWEVCRRLRATPNLSDIPIIMFTAVDEAEQKLAGFDAGADDYLTKPTEPAELVERVKMILDNRTPKAAAQTRLHQTPPPKEKRRGDTSAPLATTVTFPTSGGVTAVLGARGGAGATTLAINLASSLASTGRATTLLDLDLVQGHVALYLSQKHEHGLNNVLASPETSWPNAVQTELSKYNDYLDLMLTHAKPGNELPLWPEQIQSLLQPLIKPNHNLVIDCGHQLTPIIETVLAQANQIIVCLRPERVALAIARQLLEHLHTIAPTETSVRAVVFDFSGQMTIPHEALEKFLNHPLTAILPVSTSEMNQAVNKSIPLVQLNPSAKASILIRQIAQQLIKA